MNDIARLGLRSAGAVLLGLAAAGWLGGQIRADEAPPAPGPGEPEKKSSRRASPGPPSRRFSGPDAGACGSASWWRWRGPTRRWPTSKGQS